MRKQKKLADNLKKFEFEDELQFITLKFCDTNSLEVLHKRKKLFELPFLSDKKLKDSVEHRAVFLDFKKMVDFLKQTSINFYLHSNRDNLMIEMKKQNSAMRFFF